MFFHHPTLFCSSFGMASSWPILLLCAAHGDLSIPTEAFKGVSHKDSGWSLQALLHPFPVVAAPVPGFWEDRGGSQQDHIPQESRWAASSSRWVQTTPAKGRQGAEGTDPHPQAGREGNGTWAMSEGPQPTAKSGKNSHITHHAFTAILLHS